MIYGIGIDLIEVNRIEELLERQEKRFLERLLTNNEMKHLPTNKRRRIEYVAGRFAGKEALSKALGTGIGGSISWTDLEVIPLTNGRPEARINKNIIDKLELPPFNVHISISHTKNFAIAKVIIEQK